MDNKEAIEALRDLLDTTQEYPHLDGMTMFGEALNMAIAALEQQEKAFNEWCTDCKEYDHNRNCCPRYNRVIRGALDEVKQQGWIPVTEKPKKPKYQLDTYLVYAKYERFGIADYFVDGSWIGYDIDGDQIRGDEIAAWRPLPKPYQEDKA